MDNVDLAQEKWRDKVASTTYYSQMNLSVRDFS